LTHPALRGIPTGQGVHQFTLDILMAGTCAYPASVIRQNEIYYRMRSLPRRPGSSTSRYARYNVAGGLFPVGLSSLRLLTMYFLSQARPLGGLHRASPVPFRASYFTSGLHPPDATAQRLTAYWYRQRSFPLIPSPRFVAHFHDSLLSVSPIFMHRSRPWIPIRI
jgi:hypothetical protein